MQENDAYVFDIHQGSHIERVHQVFHLAHIDSTSILSQEFSWVFYTQDSASAAESFALRIARSLAVLQIHDESDWESNNQHNH